MKEPFSVTIDARGIAKIVFDLPGEKVNTFSLETLEGFEKILDQLRGDASVRALTIASGKLHIFIAGADIKMFEEALDDPVAIARIIETGHRVFNKLAKLPFPTFALIEGACLGGGLELALACSYRVVLDHPKTLLGLPEAKIGLFPGWGGTQRLPRLVGLRQSLKMILSGDPVSVSTAWGMKLVDAVFSPDEFQKKSEAFILSCLLVEGVRKVEEGRKDRGFIDRLMDETTLGRRCVFWMMRRALAQEKAFPAPLAAVNLIEDSYHLPLEEGLRKEIEAFVANDLAALACAKEMIACFFANRRGLG